MGPRSAAQQLAAGRIVVGLGLLVAPRLVGRAWIGDDADRPGATVFARALGIRDLLLGAFALRSPIPHVVGACAAADAVDLVATLARRDDLPATAVAGTVAVAGGATIAGLALAVALRDSGE